MGYYIVENEHATNYRNLVLEGLTYAEAVADALEEATGYPWYVTPLVTTNELGGIDKVIEEINPKWTKINR
jgi:hypothetical protein